MNPTSTTEVQTIERNLLYQREAIAFALFSIERKLSGNSAMAEWRKEGDARAKHKVEASMILGMLELFGIRPKTFSSKKLEEFLAELITVPAAPAYSIEEDGPTKNELPNSKDIG